MLACARHNSLGECTSRYIQITALEKTYSQLWSELERLREHNYLQRDRSQQRKSPRNTTLPLEVSCANILYLLNDRVPYLIAKSFIVKADLPTILERETAYRARLRANVFALITQPA